MTRFTPTARIVVAVASGSAGGILTAGVVLFNLSGSAPMSHPLTTTPMSAVANIPVASSTSPLIPDPCPPGFDLHLHRNYGIGGGYGASCAGPNPPHASPAPTNPPSAEPESSRPVATPRVVIPAGQDGCSAYEHNAGPVQTAHGTTPFCAPDTGVLGADGKADPLRAEVPGNLAVPYGKGLYDGTS